MKRYFLKIVIATIVLGGSLINSKAQNQQHIDSLKRQLDLVNDSVKAEIYIQLSNEYISSDPELALDFADKGEKLGIEINEPVLMGRAKSRKGVAYYYMNQMELSTENYFEALSIFDSLDLLYEKARSLNNIGWNLRLNYQLDDAIAYFKQGLTIAKELEEADLVQAIYNNLGTAYRHKNEKQLALETYMESLKINEQKGNKKWEAFNLNNIGLIYHDIGEYDKSENAFLKARDINLDLGQLDEYAKNLLNLSSVLVDAGEPDLASVYLEQADSIIDANNFSREKLIYYYDKARLLKNNGNYKEAAENLQKYIELDREINRLSPNNQISVLRRKYELAQEAVDLQIFKQKVQEQRFVIFGTIGLSLFLVAILLLVIKLYNSKNKWAKNIEKLNAEVREKNEELQAMNEEVHGINSNLEQLVKDRTIRIQEQNDKLIKYAFINSHEIRGPLARLLGLQYLMSLEKGDYKNNKTFKLLCDTTKELDEVISQASQLLADEDFFIEKGKPDS